MYHLSIGDRTYSSWSLRGWLLLAKFEIPAEVNQVRMYTEDFASMIAGLAPARTVPTLRIEDQQHPVWDSLAIAETLHERHPEAGLWPKDAGLRTLARSLAAEMHSGFSSLRDECTMNLAYAYDGFPVSDAVSADLARLETLWSYAIGLSKGPWLCGSYSVADVFFAPVATRIATYGLPVSALAKSYVEAHLADPALRQWRAMGRAENYVQSVYELDCPRREWPGPVLKGAQAVPNGKAENTDCPFSGKAVGNDHLAQINGRVIGFCNAFCRDKSVADPGAWPQLAPYLS